MSSASPSHRLNWLLLLRYLSPYRWQALLLAGILAATIAIQLATPLLAGRFIDVAVLNAAVMPKVDFDASDEEWNAALELALQVNTRSQLTLIRRAVAHFLAAGGGSIVGLSSWASQRGAGNANLVGYAASKAATAAAVGLVTRFFVPTPSSMPTAPSVKLAFTRMRRLTSWPEMVFQFARSSAHCHPMSLGL